MPLQTAEKRRQGKECFACCTFNKLSRCGRNVLQLHFGSQLCTKQEKRISNKIASGDSDREVLDDGCVEETFVAEENKESPEEVP